MILNFTPEQEQYLQLARTQAYHEGLRDGIHRYAHWRDGVEYVGTTGGTLAEALEDINRAENVKKGFADRRLTQNQKKAIISVLLNNITNFGKEWPEQEVCVKFIKERRLF